jgi:hypothetical protein
MSPLAEAVYTILRSRVKRVDPRITYAELAAELRDQSDDFEFISHRSQALYAALTEVGAECRRLKLPLLPALVVRADTRRPGDAYYGGTGVFKGEQVAAWRREVEGVRQAIYPPR